MRTSKTITELNEGNLQSQGSGYECLYSKLELEEFAMVAAAICTTSFAFIHLLGEHAQWNKGNQVGIALEEFDALCKQTESKREVFEIQDVSTDERFIKSFAHLKSPQIRFYAGLPLTTKNGYKIGTICVADICVGTLNEAQKKALHLLSEQVGKSFELKYELQLMKQSTNQLQEFSEASETAYKKLLSLSNEAILIHDYTTILSVNPAAIKLLGGQCKEDILGKNILDFINPLHRESFKEKIFHTTGEGTSIEIQKFIPIKGNIFYAEVIFADIFHERNPAKHIILRDVSSEVKARAELYKTNEEFKTLADNSTDIISRVNKELKYTFVNKTITPESGKPPEFYVGKTPREVGFPESMCVLIENNIREVTSSGKPKTDYFEYPGVIIKKFSYSYMTTVPEYDAEGDIVSYLISVKDITDLKLNELKLIQANKELDRFVYSASHEVRAPLKSILGLTKIALEDHKRGKYEFNEQYLQNIQFTILRLDKLVNDIIDYSRNSRLHINAENINLKGMIDEVLHDLDYINNIKIEKQISIEEEIPFFSDHRRIRIILTNLISNALKYADARKTDRFISINVKTTPDKCCISISDNGIGIEAIFLDKIYAMFFRATPIGEGAGLGLYIVKETIDKMNGDIKVTSTLYEGTCFEIELPNQISEIISF